MKHLLSGICRYQGLYYDNLGTVAPCHKKAKCERYLQYETGRVFATTLCSPIDTTNQYDCYIGD